MLVMGIRTYPAARQSQFKQPSQRSLASVVLELPSTPQRDWSHL